MPKSVLFDREDVIKKVTQLFLHKGYNATSMQDLVDVTGLNRSSIYNSFGDKFKLYEESLRYYQKMQNDNLQSRIKLEESPRAAITFVFESIRDEIIQGKQDKGCLITNCTTELGGNEPKIRDFLLRNQESMVTMFSTLIEQAQEMGEIAVSKDPKQLALYLFSSLHGLRLISILDHQSSDIEDITNQILKSL
ncbi:TetR/AcrR family transcriptional regulator [Fulvivirga sp. M361]|uniref:TetR/AcrR family transcriptional regulator n=1 Tax=Fulvivirga sp. M361 TaxID=2594266 RepID=UPI001179905C|nr:TetR/AcrR family transcriptional regulator [Fulvivirga sp. M361]TRX61766.1 TetR/AcrR family transcriptional regulator [Fulvivirga sp. M361]